jgi:EmrB/QacA subfamily drug resistance transporter
VREAPSLIGPPATAPAGAKPGLDYKWIASGVVIVGALTSILNQTVVNVALPTLESDFNVSLTDIQWVVTGYALGLAAIIPLTGWLSDRYGTKRVFMVSQILFTLSSILCAMAWSNGSLIAFRVIQGLAGGLIMPVGMTILMMVSRPEERGRMLSVMGLPMLVGPVLGPLLGGWLVQWVSWRLIFVINVPIGVVGALLSALYLRGPGGATLRQRPDLGGLALGIPAVVAIVYGLSQPSSKGWNSVDTLVPLIGGAAMVVVFCLYELRQSSPLIEIRVFRDAAFSAAMTVNFLIALALFGTVLLVPLFLQQVQGYGALDAGVVLAAQGVAAAVAMPIGGMLTDRFGARQVVPFGLALLTGATIWMATLAPDTPRWVIALMLAARGAGMGLSMMQAMSSAYITMAARLISRATSVSQVVNRVGSGLGVAIVATILSDRIVAYLPPLPRGASASSGGGLAAAHLPPAVKRVLLAQVAKGFDDTFWMMAGVTLLCFPMALLLRRPLAPAAVRAFGLRQLTEGVILGAAARRVGSSGSRAGSNGLGPKVASQRAFEVLAAAARGRLQRGLAILRGGTNAAGLVPQPALSLIIRIFFVVVMAAALVGMVVAVAHGYQTPVVPKLTVAPT